MPSLTSVAIVHGWKPTWRGGEPVERIEASDPRSIRIHMMSRPTSPHTRSTSRRKRGSVSKVFEKVSYPVRDKVGRGNFRVEQKASVADEAAEPKEQE